MPKWHVSTYWISSVLMLVTQCHQCGIHVVRCYPSLHVEFVSMVVLVHGLCFFCGVGGMSANPYAPWTFYWTRTWFFLIIIEGLFYCLAWENGAFLCIWKIRVSDSQLIASVCMMPGPTLHDYRRGVEGKRPFSSLVIQTLLIRRHPAVYACNTKNLLNVAGRWSFVFRYERLSSCPTG